MSGHRHIDFHRGARRTCELVRCVGQPGQCDAAACVLAGQRRQQVASLLRLCWCQPAFRSKCGLDTRSGVYRLIDCIVQIVREHQSTLPTVRRTIREAMLNHHEIIDDRFDDDMIEATSLQQLLQLTKFAGSQFG